MIYILAALTMITLAVLNRIAGGGFIIWATGEEGDWLLKRWLPGKPLYWIAIAVGAVAWLWLPWDKALALAFAYFIWRLPMWGPYLPMGRLPWVAVRGRFDAAIRSISFGSQRLAMFWRFLFTSPAITPYAWLTQPTVTYCVASMIVSTIGLWSAYEIGWRSPWQRGITSCELLSGSFWSLYFLMGVLIGT